MQISYRWKLKSRNEVITVQCTGELSVISSEVSQVCFILATSVMVKDPEKPNVTVTRSSLDVRVTKVKPSFPPLHQLKFTAWLRTLYKALGDHYSMFKASRIENQSEERHSSPPQPCHWSLPGLPSAARRRLAGLCTSGARDARGSRAPGTSWLVRSILQGTETRIQCEPGRALTYKGAVVITRRHRNRKTNRHWICCPVYQSELTKDLI